MVVEAYIIVYVVLTFGGFIFFAARMVKRSVANTIVPGQLGLIDYENAVYVDVRTSKERGQRAMEGTIHWPHDRIHELQCEKSEIIVTYCNSGIRAWKAAEVLKEMGFKKAYCYSGTDLQLEEERKSKVAFLGKEPATAV